MTSRIRFLEHRSLNLFLIFLLLIISGSLSGQSFSYPIFEKSEKILLEYIPANWFLKDSSAGDLNGDKIPDLVAVIEYKDTIEEIRPDSLIIKASPRVLLVLFKNVKTGNYDLVLQNNTFIIRYDESGMKIESFGKVTISKNILKISFYFFHGMSTYKFRFQNGDFYLIGGTSSGVAGGQLTKMDINFLTKKVKCTSGDLSGEKDKIEWKTISIKELKRLRDYKMPFSLEVLPDIYF